MANLLFAPAPLHSALTLLRSASFCSSSHPRWTPSETPILPHSNFREMMGHMRLYQEVTFLTRVAFRDNSSQYYISNRANNFTEVTTELKGKGVDLDNNRFLILQGKVEQISLMKPKVQGPHDEGFLEYLEDVIGTNQYVEKIDEAFKQLEVLNEKRSAAVQMVKLAEKEEDSLESVKDEAETYMLKELLSL